MATVFRLRTVDDFRDFNQALINPPAKTKGEYPVHYLYHDVLLPDSLLNIIETYLYSEGESWIFPRFHQRRAVRKLFDDLQRHYKQMGKLDRRYLIQHSAGSGKSNTIVWLVQNLRNLFVNNVKLFDSVVVVTDRVNLDGQISADFKKAIGQTGVVAYAESTAELRQALNDNTKVIVSTLHKFSYLKELDEKDNKRICFIIDEGHRSHSDRLHDAMTESFFTSNQLIEDIERKAFPNAAFIALTATPNEVALQKFGTERQGGRGAFDTYSMDEAIKEGYILDVVKNLITYETLYELNYKYDNASEYPPLQIYRALKQKAYEDDEVIREKVDIMLSIFEQQSVNKIDGRAKAMVVAPSRLAAVKYKLFFDAALARKRLSHKTLVAFSGNIDYEDERHTEESMNRATIPARELKLEDAFAEDDAIRFLIVANKFQTGFDEPLLHTMFLDKSVNDVNAVQTLSRLNRKHPDKDDTLVVDFSNSYDKIISAFRKFQNDVETHKEVDPNALSLIYQELLKRDVFTLQDIKECNRLYNSENLSDAAPFAGLLADLKKRFEEKYKEKDTRREFRALLGKYINLFHYVRSLFRMPEDDFTEFYVFAKYLHSALDTHLTYGQLLKEMEHVHLTKHLVREISPDEPEEREKPGGGVGNPLALPPLATVEEIVSAVNERFRQAISPEDINTVEHYLHEVSEDEELIMDVHSNLDADPDVIYDQILKDKLSGRYTDYVINHAADRYENLNEEDLLGFVQRNAYQLLRQAARSILGDLG